MIPRADGSPVARYCSDRIPETIGRGGYLIHPFVDGVLADYTTDDDGLYVAGEHCGGWRLGDWDDLEVEIETALDDPDHREAVAARGRAHVIANHTYEVRMGQVMAGVASWGT